MKNRIFCGIVFFVMIITSIGVKADHVMLGPLWNKNTVSYYYENFNSSRAKSYFRTGANAWNSTDMSFVVGSASNYDIYCGETGRPYETWDGITYWTLDDNGYFASQTLLLNYSYTKTWNDDNALKSVVVHEFGHCAGLDHRSGEKSIMNPTTWGNDSRYEYWGVVVPQTKDINSVNYYY